MDEDEHEGVVVDIFFPGTIDRPSRPKSPRLGIKTACHLFPLSRDLER